MIKNTHTTLKSRRKIDFASLFLMIVGIISFFFSYFLIEVNGFSSLIIVPSVVATTIGATHLTKIEAARE